MNHIILYDGVCALCNGGLRFVVERDPEGVFHFVALQSEKGKELLQKAGLPRDTLDMVVLIEGEVAFMKSTASLRILRRLKGWWKILSLLLLVPASIRDLAYDFVARRRYRWFGRYEECLAPTPEIRDRILS